MRISKELKYSHNHAVAYHPQSMYSSLFLLLENVEHFGDELEQAAAMATLESTKEIMS